jgi:hypothetical protein
MILKFSQTFLRKFSIAKQLNVFAELNKMII